MQKHYSHNTSFTDFNGISLPSHSPRQSTINAILQYAEIYPDGEHKLRSRQEKRDQYNRINDAAKRLNKM